jgi:hypothetical protein
VSASLAGGFELRARVDVEPKENETTWAGKQQALTGALHND